MSALKQYRVGGVIAWCRGGGAESVVHYSFESQHVLRTFLTQSLSLELEEVSNGNIGWEEVCYILYLCVRVANVEGVVAVAPDIPLLASAGARYRRVTAEGPVDDDAPKPLGNTVDIDIRFPPKQCDYPKALSKAAHERPTEGVITTIKPNKNFHLIHPQIVKVEGATIQTINFCNGGGEEGDWCNKCIQQAVSECAQRSQPSGDGNADDNRDGSDVDGWPARQQSKHARKQIKNVAQRLPDKTNAVLTQPIPDSPESAAQEEHDVPNGDADGIS